MSHHLAASLSSSVGNLFLSPLSAWAASSLLPAATTKAVHLFAGPEGECTPSSPGQMQCIVDLPMRGHEAGGICCEGREIASGGHVDDRLMFQKQLRQATTSPVRHSHAAHSVCDP